MLMRAGWLRTAAAAVAVGVLVGGCTGDSEPVGTGAATTLQTTGPALTPSSAPSHSAPTPAAMAAPSPPTGTASPTAESARDTATYFLQLYPFAYWTGDLAEWDRLAAPTCIYCSKTRDDVARVTNSGHRVTGGAIEITDVRGDAVEEGALFSVFAHFQEAPSQELDGAGDVAAASDGGSYTALVAMRWTGASWSVDAVDVSRAS